MMMKRKVEAGVDGIADMKVEQFMETSDAETNYFAYHFCIHRAYGLILCKKYSAAAKDLENASGFKK